MLDYTKFKKIHSLFAQGDVEAARRMLMEVQARYIALHDELSALQQQVKEFEDILFLSQNLILDGELYWLRTGEIRHGPFCKSCYELSGKLMRLERHTSVWRCPYCGVLHSREPETRGALAAHSPPARQGKIIPFMSPAHPC